MDIPGIVRKWGPHCPLAIRQGHNVKLSLHLQATIERERERVLDGLVRLALDGIWRLRRAAGGHHPVQLVSAQFYRDGRAHGCIQGGAHVQRRQSRLGDGRAAREGPPGTGFRGAAPETERALRPQGGEQFPPSLFQQLLPYHTQCVCDWAILALDRCRLRDIVRSQDTQQ